jgi:hypothetical protein
MGQLLVCCLLLLCVSCRWCLQGCLSSAVAEPAWLNPWQAPAQSNLRGWAAVLTAAEQLVSM